MVNRITGESTSALSQALLRLASIDPIDLCHEAKVETCKATRDLRRCSGSVHRVLVSCDHAALCDECIQRCELCPICRTPFPKRGDELPLRLYDECIEAGLIPEKQDGKLRNSENGDNQQIADVQRLYSLFDVALENNLVTLICHYVTDVCMNEIAVSSDPVIAFLLDEKVVIDWCRWTFTSLSKDLQVKYNYTVNEMKGESNFFLRILSKLAGLSKVLEVLESSFRVPVSALLQDLNHLHDSILKTKQHLEIMVWCITHQFLTNMSSRHPGMTSWKSSFAERKSAANKQAWPDSMNQILKSNEQCTSSLFIEDALKNLDSAQEYTDYDEAVCSLMKGEHNSYKFHGMTGSYPFENIRTAVDLLFLQGSSDLVVAKQAIFLYYVFDCYWAIPSEDMRHIVEDFAVAFKISRHSLLESYIFFLLDDSSDLALKEAISLLPEIASPDIHPKIARVLLERQNPDAALMALRCSGLDWGVAAASPEEAITAVRTWVECGLLTEAFMYQRKICEKVKTKNPMDLHDKETNYCHDWLLWLEALVTEICCLCIRRNLVDRMIELPWNSDEEKHLHKALLEYATIDPSSNAGSLLVVFYLQRYRYTEAYEVDSKLQALEDNMLSESCDEVLACKVRSTSHWRKRIVDQSVHLLPDVAQQKLKNNGGVSAVTQNESPSAKTDVKPVQQPLLGSVLFKDPRVQLHSNSHPRR